MPIKVSCNSCGGVLHAPEDAAGKRGRCPTCGTILNIPADGPRVSGDSAQGTAPVFAPPPPEPRAAPFAPEPARASFGAAPVAPSPAYAPRQAAPRPPAAAGFTPGRVWNRVAGGIVRARWGVVLIALGVLAPTLIVILEQNGVKLPEKNPGYLGVKDVYASGEIKVASALAFFLLGGLLLTLGRFGVASVPRESGARGVALAAAWATLLAFLSFAAIVLFAIVSTLDQAPPQIVPLDDITKPNVMLQQRIYNYSQHFFLDADNPPGQVQRLGAVFLIVGGLVAELWFLGALSRIASYLRNGRASGRVNRFVILAGLLIVALALGSAAYDIFGRQWAHDTINPKWNALSGDTRVLIRAGGAALVVAVMALLYLRALHGVRAAIREMHP